MRGRAALAFGAAGALAAIAALSVEAGGPPEARQQRETAPLAALISAVIGALTGPRLGRPSHAILQGAALSLVGLALFAVLYGLAEGVIAVVTETDGFAAGAIAGVARVWDQAGAATLCAAPLFALASWWLSRRGARSER